MFIDEVSYIARSRTVRCAADAMGSGQGLTDFIKQSRRNRVALDLATQKPLEILPDIHTSVTNVFFRDLPKSRDKSRSQIDFLVDSLQL